MKKTIFEEMGGTYIRHGDYLIPCLTLPEEEQRFIGVWGQRHLRYLKEYSRSIYLNLLKDANENGVKLSHQAPTLYDVVPKMEIK